MVRSGLCPPVAATSITACISFSSHPWDVVWEAFKRVKANQGAAGVDEQSIAEFEADLRNNLYKLWNRL
jgi:retron-type reverse transcriptase